MVSSKPRSITNLMAYSQSKRPNTGCSGQRLGLPCGHDVDKLNPTVQRTASPTLRRAQGPLNHQPLLLWYKMPQSPRSAAEWEDGVRARLASKGAIIQANLASPVAAATRYATLRGCYAKPFR